MVATNEVDNASTGLRLIRINRWRAGAPTALYKLIKLKALCNGTLLTTTELKHK